MSSRVGSHACCRRGRRHWLSCFAERESGKLAGGLGPTGSCDPPTKSNRQADGPPLQMREGTLKRSGPFFCQASLLAKSFLSASPK